MKFNLIVLAAASTSALSFRKIFAELRTLLRDDMSTCDIANMGNKCNKGAACPPCWIKNNEKYDCYDKVNGQCPWAGMIDRSANSKYPASTCLYGNQAGNSCDTTKQSCPPCWIQSGGNWGCYALVNNQCPFPGMTQIQN